MLFTTGTIAQQKNIYFFDAYWQSTKEKNATYLVRHKKLPDNTWQLDYYNYRGPLIKTETFADDKATLRQGRFTFYDRSGRVDSTGYYNKNLREKSWYYYANSDSAKVLKKVDYENGVMVKVTTPADEKRDSTTADEKESEFPGAQQGWIAFLNKEFRYPERAMDFEIQGQVRILFAVNTSGQVEEPVIYKSVELSLDDESLRVLGATPAWIPGMKNGEKVKTYKIQPFTFRLVTR